MIGEGISSERQVPSASYEKVTFPYEIDGRTSRSLHGYINIGLLVHVMDFSSADTATWLGPASSGGHTYHYRITEQKMLR